MRAIWDSGSSTLQTLNSDQIRITGWPTLLPVLVSNVPVVTKGYIDSQELKESRRHGGAVVSAVASQQEGSGQDKAVENEWMNEGKSDSLP